MANAVTWWSVSKAAQLATLRVKAIQDAYRAMLDECDVTRVGSRRRPVRITMRPKHG